MTEHHVALVAEWVLLLMQTGYLAKASQAAGRLKHAALYQMGGF
jgi:hypothetical protein